MSLHEIDSSAMRVMPSHIQKMLRSNELERARRERRAPVGMAFEIGGILCMRCDNCLVVRELSEFWTPCKTSKPAAARRRVCIHCT